jgi:diaminopimelate decarboxylase
MEQIDFKSLSELDKQYGSPFYIMDSDCYKHNINSFLKAFKNRYEKVVAGYSFKTNYVPALCNIAKEEGCYAEVVSEMELDLALKLGFDNIIFNGPIKRQNAVIKAIDHSAIINIDSEYEIDFICNYVKQNPKVNPKVGLRINVNLVDENGNSTIQCGLRFGRFGFPDDILERNINRLQDAGIKIVSLHGHTSSSDRAVINYKVITQHMLNVCQKYNLTDLQYFDIGGGYFGAAPSGMDLSGRPKYEDYANIVLDTALSNDWFVRVRPTIVIEPGSSVASNVFTYYTKVYQNKHIGQTNFVMVDGTVFDVKPTLHSNNLPFKPIQKFNAANNYFCNIVGSTCMEKDVILKDVLIPQLQPGDFIEIRGVGAYTICLTPTFINFLAPILVKNDKTYSLVRRRQTIDDVLTIYNI